LRHHHFLIGVHKVLWVCGLRKRKERLNTRKGIGVGPVLNLPISDDEDDTGESVFDLESWFQSDVDESDEEIFNLDDWDLDANDIPLPET